MTSKMLALALGLSMIAAPAFAQTTGQAAETNRQSPAPQGTVAPERNDNANTGASTGTTGSEEQMNNQTPGMAEPTDLSKKAKTGSANGTTSNREATNPEQPAPNNTVKPQ